MVRLFILLFLAPALAKASSLEEAFTGYVKLRQLEEKGPSPELSQAHAGLPQLLQPDAELAGWQKALMQRVALKKPARPEAEGLAYLEKTYPQARRLSPLEWEIIREWFGPQTQEAFLRSAFRISDLETEATATLTSAIKIIWVLDPYGRLYGDSTPLKKQALEKDFPSLETLAITPFSQVENQADELKQFLLSQKQPFVLVSGGDASAIVHKTLDLYPGLRSLESLTGWVNVNGRLYGRAEKKAPGKPGRGLASVQNSLPDQFESNALEGLKSLRKERVERATPLGKGFPILNLVSERSRPCANLREALVMEGTTWFVKKDEAWKSVRNALPLLNAAGKP